MSEAPPSPASVKVLHDDDDKKKPLQDPPSTAHEEEEPRVPQSTHAMTTLIRYLEHEGWSFLRREHLILSHLSGRNGSFRLVVDVRQERDPDQRILLVYVTAPIKVPPERRLAVVEYTTRANWAVVVGNFEMDLADGEILYKGCLDYADGEVTLSMLRGLILRCASTMDRYFPGLMRILYGNVDAVAAIEPIVPQGSADMAYAVAQLVEAVAVDGAAAVEKAANAVSSSTEATVAEGNEATPTFE
jgi:hypothetical protein